MSLLPFIQERLTVVEKEIKTDLFLWLSGKKNPDLEFSGTLELLYWGNYLENNITKIIQTAFTANRELANKHDTDPINTVNEATEASKQVIVEILSVMADYDQRMKGKGYPAKITKKDIKELQNHYFNLVEDSANNEVNIFNMPKKNAVNIPLASEYGIYWYIKSCHWSVHLKLIGVVFACLAIGFGAGKNETLRKLHNVFTNTESTNEIVSTKSKANIPETIDQNIPNTITETQKTDSSR
ncbi:hypothetical protein MNBD_BACTEROID05-554 [hydrothermal vent metagenome]|uniref:Uncharacterized protein n=1 Tax=hydrothermal vent metagenome TaxID=652676 RepID=A0A3B0T0S4_9ZZZZ